MNRIIHGDNLPVLAALPAAFARLVYIDPPFNTGLRQARRRMIVRTDGEHGTRNGFRGGRFSATRLRSSAFSDRFGDSYLGFLMPRIEACVRCLTPDGSIFVHTDPRESHYVKVAMDALLGRGRFMNEIVWAYDYGGRPRDRWPAKHDTILWYAMSPGEHVFNADEIDRMPYMVPRLVTPEKAARGKVPTDVWWQTIVVTNSKEKTGYPTQKPLALLRRIVRVHSSPGDIVLDAFAGSGTLGEAAGECGRGFVLIDESDEAVTVMARRLERFAPRVERTATA